SPPSPTIADVGTGSGCLAVVLARRLPQARLYALDLSPEALALARRNALRHGVADRIRFLASDLLQALPEPVDLIVANPPYVAEAEWDRLPRSVRRHEPRLALAGGPDGLAVIRRLLAQAPAYLRPGGRLLMEIGAGQGNAVLALARAAFPTAQIALHPDLAGHPRVLAVHRASHATHPTTRKTLHE
ncbi:MAG: HemK family protein methyltransferase, partial [Chloroflexi bacterium]